MKLDNPLRVRWEYASEERFAKRNDIFRALMPEIDGAFRATTRHVAFIAEKAG